MRLSDKQFEKLVLVCVNEREDGSECCGQKGSLELFHKLKAAIKLVRTDTRVSRTGCLGNCASGITVAIMPKNVYLGGVQESDIEEIVKMLAE
ncbi:MAG: (2Fe-2S) ferredoxin domain-containing protein [Patescibacteria group bacterium]